VLRCVWLGWQKDSAGDPAARDLKLRTLGPLFCLAKLAKEL